MGKIRNFFAKIKSVKNIELYIALALAVVVVALIFLTPKTQQNSSQNVVDSQSYIAEMENKLVAVLENIEGCGKVSVAIAYSTDGEKVYAYETKKDISNGETVEVTTLVTVKGEPLVIKTLTPNIIGVVVVADGADDAIIKHKIKQAVVTLLNIDSSCVQVFS